MGIFNKNKENKKECVVFYEYWQMECCGKEFSTNSIVKWPVVKNDKNIKLSFKTDKIDYFYEAHSENTYIIEGTVKEIKAVFEKYKPSTIDHKVKVPVDGDSFEIEHSEDIISLKKDNMNKSGYIVYLTNYFIQPV